MYRLHSFLEYPSTFCNQWNTINFERKFMYTQIVWYITGFEKTMTGEDSSNPSSYVCYRKQLDHLVRWYTSHPTRNSECSIKSKQWIRSFDILFPDPTFLWMKKFTFFVFLEIYFFFLLKYAIGCIFEKEQNMLRCSDSTFKMEKHKLHVWRCNLWQCIVTARWKVKHLLPGARKQFAFLMLDLFGCRFM